MMVHSKGRVGLLLVALAACGPSPGATTTGGDSEGGATLSSAATSDGEATSGQTSVDPTATGGTESSTSTGVEGECTLEVEGDVIIEAEADLAAMSGVRRVKGGRLIIQDFAGVNLDGLSCLEEVDSSLWIQRTSALTNLSGLGGLQSALSLELYDNDRLETTAGLDSLSNLSALRASGNPELAEVVIPEFATLQELTLGQCVTTNNADATFLSAIDNPKLTDLAGLSGVAGPSRFEIGGQSGLVSVVSMHAAAESGTLSGGRFTHNSSLASEEIDALRSVMGETDSIISCQNFGEPTAEECTLCPIE